jgi:hypothetical protein
MAEFSYYTTFNESLDLLRDIVAVCKLRVIPDVGLFPRPEAPSFEEVTAGVVEQLRKRRALFLAGSFTTRPPEMRMLSGGANAGKYYVSEDRGGPLVQMALSTITVVSGLPIIVGGDIGHQRQYIDPVSDQEVSASPELKRAFKCIVATAKKHLVQHQLGAKIWIGPEALRLLKAGEAHIHDRGVL